MQLKTNSKFYSPCNNLEIIRTLIYNQLSCYDQNGNADKAQQLKELFDLFHFNEELFFEDSEED